MYEIKAAYTRFYLNLVYAALFSIQKGILPLAHFLIAKYTIVI
jgi:hypothetical protein